MIRQAQSRIASALFLGLLSFSTLVACPWDSDEKKEEENQPAEGSSVSQGETPSTGEGDTFTFAISANPQGLIPLTTSDLNSSKTWGRLFESLLDRDLDTYEWEPSIAKSWSISEDGKSFTFVIDENARFWDGSPVTSDDVIFSFNLIFYEGVDTASLKPYYQAIKSVTATDKQTVVFTTNDVYFKNFDVAAGLTILKKDFYEKLYKEDNSLSKATVTRQAMGTGMWKVDSWDENRRIVLSRDPNYWAKDRMIADGLWNFSRIVIQIIPDTSVELETLKKGELSYFAPTPKQFAREMDGKPFGSTVQKVQTTNKWPPGYRFIAWNLKNPLFESADVRWALSHIANLELWNEKFNFGLSEATISPVSPKSEFYNPDLKLVPFDLNLARQRLASAGWTKAGDDGFLLKDGKKFSFTIMFPTQAKDTYEPILTEYKNQAAKVGIQIQLRALEWTSFTKLLDERNFDAVVLGWASASVESDFKQVWHSESIANNGSNFISYANPTLDKLIDEHRKTLDANARLNLTKEIAKTIYNDQPYTFLLEPKYVLYAHPSSITKPKDTFNYGVGMDYWKLSPR